MPIDSLEPFRQSLQFSKPYHRFSKFKIISSQTDLKNEKEEEEEEEEDKNTTIYLWQEGATEKYRPLYWEPTEGFFINLLADESKETIITLTEADESKETIITLTENEKNFLDIASKCNITELDAYYWANPYENFINNLNINTKGKDSIYSFISNYKIYSDDIPGKRQDASENPSQKTFQTTFTGLDGLLFFITTGVLRILHRVLRYIPGFVGMLIEKAERALAEKSAPLWDNNNKTLWFVYAIPRGFFFLLKQPFKLAETAISTVFQTIDIALILSYSVTNIICGGLRPAKWKESWELVKESLPRLYSITLVRGFFIGLIGALAFFAPEILAFLGIGTAAGVAVLAVTGTAITATPKVLDEASEHCCPSSNNIINTGLKKPNSTIATSQKIQEQGNKSKSNPVDDSKTIIPTPIIVSNFTESTITMNQKYTLKQIKIGKRSFTVKNVEGCYKLNGLTEKEKKNLAVDAETYNNLFCTNKITPKDPYVFDESTSLENLKYALTYFPAHEWCFILYDIACKNDANSIMEVFFSACSERAKPDCKFYTLNNPSADTYMQEALHLLVFLQHISKILSQSKHDDANIIKDSLDSESRISIAYSYQQAQKNYILYNQLPRGEEKNKAFENLKIYHREMFERVAELNTLYKSTDWSKVGIDRSSSVQPTIPHHHTTQFSKDRDRDRDSGSDNNNSITESVNLSV